MELPSFSYRAPRDGLTSWSEGRSQTELHYTAVPQDPLFASHTRDNPRDLPRGTVPPVPAAEVSSPDAARHAVLRRLAPALKHDMVVNLQAVSMMAEMLNARLDRGGPQAADLQANISKLNRLAREAVLKCLNVSTWIEPGEDDTVSLTQGVKDCVTLMSGSFNFRGYLIVNETPEMDFEVSRGGLRNLVAASLIAMADNSPSPSQLRIAAEVAGGFAVVTITCEPQGDEAERLLPEAPVHRVDWEHVEALATDERAEIHHTDDRVVIRLPRALPTSPLRMAPI